MSFFLLMKEQYKCGGVEDEENLALQIQSFDWLKTLCLKCQLSMWYL